MKLYRAVALDQQGRRYAGTFQAPSEEAAVKMLSSEGYTRIISLEEILDATVEREDVKFRTKKDAPQDFSKNQLSGNTPAGWARFYARYGSKLGILKPFIFCALALVCIPMGISLFAPEKPDRLPDDTVGIYFQHEFARDFQAQYELFSMALRHERRSAEIYDSERKRGLGEVPADAPIPYLESLEILSEKKSAVELRAYVRRGPLVDAYRFGLKAEGKDWRIHDVEKLSTQDVPLLATPHDPALQAPGAKAAKQMLGSGSSAVARKGLRKSNNTSLKQELRESVEQARRQGKLTEEAYQKKLALIESMEAS